MSIETWPSTMLGQAPWKLDTLSRLWASNLPAFKARQAKSRATRFDSQVVTDQEGRGEAFKAFLERSKSGLVAPCEKRTRKGAGVLASFSSRAPNHKFGELEECFAGCHASLKGPFCWNAVCLASILPAVYIWQRLGPSEGRF